MIKSYTITISEIDDADAAIEEYKQKIKEITLMRNTVGIVTVHVEYINSEVYLGVAKAASFPLIGSTTLSQTTREESGTFLFSILVLTSDDCEFSCECSDDIPEAGSVTEVTQTCYNKAYESLSSNPLLAILLVPPLANHYPNKYVKALSEVNSNLPIFGTVANDDASSIYNSRVLLGENVYKNKIALLLISGNISPKFYVASVPSEAIVMPDIGEITASKGNVLLEINNKNAVEFLADIGFITGENRNRGLLSSIFMLRAKEGGSFEESMIARSLVSIVNKAAVFGGELPVGTVISIGTVTKETVMDTAQKLMEKIIENHNGGTVFMYSCIGRRYALLNEPMKELNYLKDALTDDFTLLASFSSGEISPIDTGISIKNYEHNQTLIACVF